VPHRTPLRQESPGPRRAEGTPASTKRRCRLRVTALISPTRMGGIVMRLDRTSHAAFPRTSPTGSGQVADARCERSRVVGALRCPEIGRLVAVCVTSLCGRPGSSHLSRSLEGVAIDAGDRQREEFLMGDDTRGAAGGTPAMTVRAKVASTLAAIVARGSGAGRPPWGQSLIGR
jgi:hypothetical protein